MTYHGQIDHEALRKELSKALHGKNWYLTGSNGEVTFNSIDQEDQEDQELAKSIIEQHLNGHLDRYKSNIYIDIDKASDSARLKIIVDPTRAIEYRQAEQEAMQQKATGYTGQAPPTVHTWATVKGWTDKDAADDIIATAALWNKALYTIRDIRLFAKEAVRIATSEDECLIIKNNVTDQLTQLLSKV